MFIYFFSFSVLMVLGLYAELELSIHMEKGKDLTGCLFLGVTGMPGGYRNRGPVSFVVFCNTALSLHESDDHSR